MVTSIESLHLRQAVESDCQMLWEWANEPGVRASAFSQAPIPLEDHTRWFSRKLREPTTSIFIAEDAAGKPVGQIRFDVNERGEAEIDFSIDKERRRHGYGRAILEAGIQRVFATTPACAVRGTVKLSNASSRRAFETTGFEAVSESSVDGVPVVVFSRRRPSGL